MKKTANKTTDIIKLVCVILLSLIIIFIVIGAGYFTGMYTAASREIKGMNITETAKNKYSMYTAEDEDISGIDDTDETDDGTAALPEETETPQSSTWAESEDIPKLLKDAVVSAEDENFYVHKGFDSKKDGRTITQQLIRYVMDDEDDSHRMKTMIRSMLFEKKLSKDEILTDYMNCIYFADNCYGVLAVASAYYGKDDLKSLTLGQTAAIAGMIRNPLESEPFNHSYENLERRNSTLKKMYDTGKITKSEYEDAIAEEIGVPEKNDEEEPELSPAPSGSPVRSPLPSASPSASRSPSPSPSRRPN